MITVECAKGTQHSVLQSVFAIAPVKDHSTGIIFQIALNRPEQI